MSYTMEGKKDTKAVQNLLGLEGNVILAERFVEVSKEPTSEGGTSGEKAEDGAASEETKNRNFDYYLYNKDVQGSTTSILDEDGESELSYEYDDFGETKINGSSVFRNEICYTGGIYDETTGLYYLNARYYDPENGRFLTEDTYRGELKEPDTLHLYVYCKNNPINYVDPSGHIAANVVGAVIGAVLGAVGGAVLSKWLANKLNLKGWKRKTFIVGITALVGATASAIGYFVGPYVAKTWHYLTAKLAGLLKGTYKSIKIPKQTMKHINVKKHLWNKVVKGSTDTGIKTVMYRAIRNGTWQLQKDGSVKILWMYKGEIIQVTGKVVNNVLRIGSAWVARR